MPRTLRLLAAAFLACASLLGASANPGEPGIGPVPSNLVVVLHWEQWQPSASLTHQFEKNLLAQLRSLGLEARFVTYEQATHRAFSGKIVVLRLTEDGEMARRNFPAVPANALAWTHAANGTVTPFGSVDLMALRRFTGIRANSTMSEGPRQDAFARALSRVAAHEIYHMLTRTMEHSNEGIMQPGLSRMQLTSTVELEWTRHNREMVQRAFHGGAHQDVVAAVTAKDRD